MKNHGSAWLWLAHVFGLRMFPTAGLLCSAIVGSTLGAQACSTAPSSKTECTPACQAQEPACDEGCPVIANELCLQGRCEPVGEPTVDVVIDANIERGLTGVVALLVAVVDPRVHACDDIGAVAELVGVLDGRRYEVSGGTFHPDLDGGRVPEGAIVIAIDAIDDGMEALARGCVSADATGDRVDVLVQVRP
jgi:hypothetical protein